VVVGTQSTERLFVDAGLPTFVEGDYTVPGAGDDSYAIAVQGGPVLRLGRAMTLRGLDAVIESEEDADFDSRLELRAPDAALVLAEELSVGHAAGAGSLRPVLDWAPGCAHTSG